MADQPPLSSSSSSSSDNCPLSHKRRITDLVTSLDHHPFDKPSLTLSPPPLPPSLEVNPSILELGLSATQETHSPPEHSPKKHKFSSLNLSITDVGPITDESIHVSDNNLEDETKQLDDEKLEINGGNELSQLGFEIKKEVFEGFTLTVQDDTVNVELGSETKAENSNSDGLLPNLPKTEDLTNTLKIEVIDGTALVDVSMLEMKRSQQKGYKKEIPRNTGIVVGCASNAGKRKFIYSRKELELLRFVNVKGQKKFWQKIYNGFSATVKKEYEELGCSRNHNKNCDYNKRNCSNGGVMGGYSNVPDYKNRGVLGESSSGNASCDGDNICEDGDDLVGEWSEDEESDDEYGTIYRPAFKVEGEPDFESGPPEDGLEYLRRVRWEAKQIPKVKIAKLNNVKLKDQSFYMPEIPDIEECPPHLTPLRQWEDEFIADFSNLRLSLSRLEDTSDAVTDDSESVSFGRHECKSRPYENLASLKLTPGAPILSTVLAMDPVTRVSMLRKRISLFENTSDLSRDACAWLFALCAAVETPLDADACASLRCLLRSCAKLRARKAEVDDEVIMLNVLTTISGRFFGQSG